MQYDLVHPLEVAEEAEVVVVNKPLGVQQLLALLVVQVVPLLTQLVLVEMMEAKAVVVEMELVVVNKVLEAAVVVLVVLVELC
jgi:hypothetical protein